MSLAKVNQSRFDAHLLDEYMFFASIISPATERHKEEPYIKSMTSVMMTNRSSLAKFLDDLKNGDVPTIEVPTIDPGVIEEETSQTMPKPGKFVVDLPRN